MLIAPTADAVTHNLSGNKVAAFGIAKNPAKLIQVVVRSLYSNPTLATLVELGQNAHDEHKRCGKSNVPFEVTLPTIWEPTLKVRDFGGGISHDYMMKGYTRIFESTKDEDATMSGGFGVGRCVVLSLSSTYTVVTFIQGKKRTYSVFESENGIELVHLSTENTTEVDGTEISAPVSQNEVDRFQDAAQRAYRYYEVPPIIKGAGKDYVINQPHYVLTGSNWAIESQNVRTSAICGIYHYHIESANMGVLSDSHRQLLSDIGLVLRFGPSDLDVQANRQGLHYNERTRNGIINALKVVEKEAAELIAKQFAACKSFYEAKKLWGSLYENPATRKLATISKSLGNVTWNNIPIDSDRIQLKDFKNVKATGYFWKVAQRSYNEFIKHRDGYEYITCHDNHPIFINDLGKGAICRIKGYIRDIFENKNIKQQGVALSFNDEAAKKDFFAKTHLSESDFILVSTLPKPVVTRESYNYKRAKATVFAYNGGDASPASLNWDVAEDIELESDSGIYVIIDAYRPLCKNYNMRSADFSDLMRSVIAIGGEQEIIGIRHTASEDLNIVRNSKNWKSLDQYIQELIAGYQIDNADALSIANHEEFQKVPWYLNSLIERSHYKYITKSKEFKSLVDDVIEVKNNMQSSDAVRAKHSHFIRLGGSLQLSKVPPTKKLSTIYQNFLKRFAIFEMVVSDIAYDANKVKIVDEVLALLEEKA